MYRMGAADRFGTGLRQADVENLARGHQLGKSTGCVLDGSVRVDPVLIVEVDVVDAQARQRALDRRPAVRWTAVGDTWSTTGVRHQAELRGNDNLVAPTLNRPTHDFLAVE